MVEILAEFRRRTHEKVVVLTDGRQYMVVMSNGLEQRRWLSDEFTNQEHADQIAIKIHMDIMIRGFYRV